MLYPNPKMVLIFLDGLRPNTHAPLTQKKIKNLATFLSFFPELAAIPVTLSLLLLLFCLLVYYVYLVLINFCRG
jgi:hypothetical protein